MIGFNRILVITNHLGFQNPCSWNAGFRGQMTVQLFQYPVFGSDLCRVHRMVMVLWTAGIWDSRWLKIWFSVQNVQCSEKAGSILSCDPGTLDYLGPHFLHPTSWDPKGIKGTTEMQRPPTNIAHNITAKYCLQSSVESSRCLSMSPDTSTHIPGPLWGVRTCKPEGAQAHLRAA